MQRHVDRYYRMFVESVATNRGTTPERVEAEFGQGRIVGAADAVMRGMATRIATSQEAIQDLTGATATRRRMAARRLSVSLLQR